MAQQTRRQSRLIILSHRGRWLLVGALLLVTAACSLFAPPAVTPETGGVTPIAPRSSVTRPAPDFTLTTLDGDSLTLSDYQGQVVLVNFWASWCPPCNAEVDDLNAYYEAHKDEGFTIIGVNVEDTPEDAKAFVEQHGVAFPIVIDTEAKVAGDYNVIGLPSSYFINQDGELYGFQPGIITPEELERQVTPYLQP